MIKIDLPMPKECKGCPFTYLDTGDDAYWGTNEYRCVFDDSAISEHGKLDDCPLIKAKESED